jgi:hypothetical protein
MRGDSGREVFTLDRAADEGVPGLVVGVGGFEEEQATLPAR